MSRQARQRRRRRGLGGGALVFAITGGVFATGLTIAAAAVAIYVVHIANSAPAIGKLRAIVSGGPSQVFASHGPRLGLLQSEPRRTPVGWSAIPQSLKDATVAIEDQRFYKHNGVDVTGIFRAAIKDITHGAALQGGSTITMQLVRNLYLGGNQHTLKQKIIEAK